MKRIVQITLSCIPPLALVLLVVELIVSNELAGLGQRLAHIDIALTQARQERETLITQVASASSLFAIQAKADELGFRPPTKDQVISLGTDRLPVAFHSTPQ